MSHAYVPEPPTSADIQELRDRFDTLNAILERIAAALEKGPKA